MANRDSHAAPSTSTSIRTRSESPDDDTAAPPTNPTIWRVAAVETIAALSARKLHSCLFGSAACAVYGMKHREPNDVDIIVLADKDPEEVKALLVSSSTPAKSWYLVPSQNPENTYNVLWFSTESHPNGGPNDHARCKVDILVPLSLGIPPIPPSHLVRRPLSLPAPATEPGSDQGTVTVTRTSSVPVVPLLALIFLKLRGWTDHLASHLRRFQEKTWVDEEDIDEMIRLAIGVYGTDVSVETAEGKTWMPDWFVEEGMERVGRYAVACPESVEWWTEMGFEVGYDEDEKEEEDDRRGWYYDEDDYDDPVW